VRSLPLSVLLSNCAASALVCCTHIVFSLGAVPIYVPRYVFSNVAEAEVEYMVFKLVHKDTATFKDEVKA